MHFSQTSILTFLVLPITLGVALAQDSTTPARHLAPELRLSIPLPGSDSTAVAAKIAHDQTLPTLSKLGPAPKFDLSDEQIAEAVRGVQAGAPGDVLIVDCHGNYDHTTIQGAIDAASDGDVLIVLPNTCTKSGHYFENINFIGKAITVQSIFPTDVNVVDATVINGSLLDRVVTFDSGEGEDSVLAGLTITNGTKGVRCSFASPTIRGCHITANEGGMSLGAGSAHVLSCRITNNVGSSGAGVRAGVSSSNARFISCIISGNAASSGGGGLVLSGSNGLTLRNCTIANNSAGERGGGILFISDQGASWTLSNTILWGNSAPQGPAIDIENISPIGAVPQLTVAYSDIEGGTSSIAGEGQLIWAAGNMVADPLFADADNGDLHLAPDSPCIDAGDLDTIIDPDEADLDSEERLQHCRIDIGADESTIPVDCNGNGVGDSCEIEDGTAADENGNLRPDECEIEIYADCNNCPGPGSGTVEDPYCSIQQGIDVALAGDTVVVLPSSECVAGAYLEHIDFLSKGVTVRSTIPEDPAVVAQTVIDGNGADGSVVTFAHTQELDSVLDGLTITGGLGTSLDLIDDSYDAPIHWGGGVICIDSSPTIRNCRIIGNQANHGGGIACIGGRPTIISCDISANIAVVEGSVGGLAWLPFGGGLDIWNGSAILRGCRINNNLVDGSFGDILWNGSGAGISFVSAAVGQQNLEITGCVVTANEMNGDPDFFLNGAGGGLSSWQYDPASEAHVLTIRNSMILDNLATRHGAGLSIGNGIVADIEGTTVAGNHAEAPFGSGIGGASGVVVALRNSIVHHNFPVDLNNLGVDYTFEYSDVGTTDEVEVTGPGNISADPLFVDDENGDYHLTADSPCVDAGDPDFTPEPDETDIDGDARVIGDRIDMGADEFVPACPADLNGDGSVAPEDLAILLGHWGPCPPEEDCAADLDADDQVGASDLAILLGSWGSCIQ